MPGSNRLILVDTNIIIESVRTECWNGIRGHYQVVTVEKCREEAQSGIGRTRGYVEVSDNHLSSRIQIAAVSDIERAHFVTECAEAMGLDYGERDLWAHALSRTDEWEAACADRAAVRIAMQLGWGDRLISLEELVERAGIQTKKPLKNHYTKRELGIWRTLFRLDGT
ncbi:MAG: hypothetical protein GTO51_00655 [Candidatus Latescibacteria bacterium]|nr:hypothetical protein [Candidatus Latescibacterota bacterium]NIM64492.1 hypothetical protein [Candidatus Latescibacterota bacterium]NIO00645.1 hypothetical protein [Candidatus Latescibacterota bacterium]NIO27048.1 hypothetical protein [Candidatus Latescibacterota bacterium]NIO54572.1 hypothetical protein [Candidatus Latescibacterota bacterium]